MRVSIKKNASKKNASFVPKLETISETSETISETSETISETSETISETSETIDEYDPFNSEYYNNSMLMNLSKVANTRDEISTNNQSGSKAIQIPTVKQFLKSIELRNIKNETLNKENETLNKENETLNKEIDKLNVTLNKVKEFAQHPSAYLNGMNFQILGGMMAVVGIPAFCFALAALVAGNRGLQSSTAGIIGGGLLSVAGWYSLRHGIKMNVQEDLAKLVLTAS